MPDRPLRRRRGTVLRAGLTIAAASAFARSSSAYQKRGEERVEHTAYTLRAREFSLGLWRAEFGATSEITVGTYVPTWFAFPVLHAPIPTGFVKLRDPFHERVALSAQATFVYVSADALASDLAESGEGDASLIVVPVDAATSLRYSRALSQSVELSYTLVRAGAREGSDSSIQGAAALSNLTLSTLLELRLTRVFALTLLGRLLVYQSPAHVKARFRQGSTSIDADLGLKPDYAAVTACAIPGVAFSGSNVNLELGVGYGSWWIPVVQLPLPGNGIVPEANFYVRF